MITEQKARNNEIRRLHQSGLRGIALAKRFGLSRQRIDQIIHPVRQRARQIAKDRLSQLGQACEFCGSIDAQMHHDDYARPLEVRWLCPSCHGEQHRGPRLGAGERKTEIAQVCLPPTLKAMVEAEANLRGESISTVIRWAIHDRYSGRRRPTQESSQ